MHDGLYMSSLHYHQALHDIGALTPIVQQSKTIFGFPVVINNALPVKYACETCSGTGYGTDRAHCRKCCGAGRHEITAMLVERGQTIMMKARHAPIGPARFPTGLVPPQPLRNATPREVPHG